MKLHYVINTKKIKLFMGTLLSAILVFSVLPVQPSEALSAKDWSAGNIIDDSLFYDNTSMSASQINNWIKSQLSCDINGAKTSELGGGRDYNNDGRVSRAEWAKATRGYTQKFVCLSNYYENPSNGKSNLRTNVKPSGAISAGAIIKKAADTYKISPKVLLVKIRKESPGPLTSDEWPLPSQFEAAMGYACPDPPAGQPVQCDPAYKGFYKQILNAARGLNNYKEFSSSYRYQPFKNNTILYNPYCSSSSSVYLANYATAGLYNYTPYQPNMAALANLYGTGDNCSAYGNRNFWTMYTNMFGPTHASKGSVYMTCSDGKDYLLEIGESRKRYIPEDTKIAWGLEDSQFSGSTFGCDYPTFDLALSNVVESRDSGKSYLVDNGKAYFIENQDQASAWNLGALSATRAKVDSSVILKNLSIIRTLPRVVTSDNPDRKDTYLVDNSNRHNIAGSRNGDINSLRLIRGYDKIPIATMSVKLLQTLTDSEEINYSFKVGTINYLLDHGLIRKISSSNANLWPSTATNPELSSQVLSLFSKKSTIQRGFYRDGNYYLLNSLGKITITADEGIAKNISPSSYESITRLLTNKILEESTISSELAGVSASNNIRLITCNDKKYMVEKFIKSKREITTIGLNAWGLSDKYFYKNDNGCNYPTYAAVLENAIRSRNTKKVYLTTNNVARWIKSDTEARDYGFESLNEDFPQFDPKSILSNFTIR